MRVLVGGAWGFACDRRLDHAGARPPPRRLARSPRPRAAEAAQARAARAGAGEFRTAFERDPFAVPVAEKVDLCLRAEQALRATDVKVTSASVRAQREHKVLRLLGGRLDRAGGRRVRRRHRRDGGSRRDHPDPQLPERPRRLELAGRLGVRRRARPRAEAPRVGEQAAALLRADAVPVGVTTVVIDAEQVALQVHESVGHPTELDRVYGTEAAYAGTSFLTPGDLGSLRYGSEPMNVAADSTTPGGLGTFGFDDEGVPARARAGRREGICAASSTSRETAARIGAGSGGSMRADGWSRMPLMRMTNLHLEPGEGSLEELIADVDEGVYLETNRSWSIDDKRLNFQFGTQIAWEISDGKLGRMLRDATYTGMTPRLLGLARRRRAGPRRGGCTG